MHLEPPVDYDNTLHNGGARDTHYRDKRMEKEAHHQKSQQQRRTPDTMKSLEGVTPSKQIVTSLAAIDALSAAALADQPNTGVGDFDCICLNFASLQEQHLLCSGVLCCA